MVSFERVLHQEIRAWWAQCSGEKLDRFGRFERTDRVLVTLEKRRVGTGVVLKQIWLAPELRRRGICTRLLTNCLEQLTGVRFVLLERVLTSEMRAVVASLPRYASMSGTSDYCYTNATTRDDSTTRTRRSERGSLGLVDSGA